MNKRKIFIILFAILYISVAFVSTFHAIAFFELANTLAVAILLAITFEIGQAAVLFSILTNATKNKVVPWFLMIVLTLVQILGNVFSSYKYLITNSEDLLRYFKEPIFVWMDMPDQQCNVILTYIIGAILPIVSLLMTSMVTNYLEKTDDNIIEDNKKEDKQQLTNVIGDINNSLTELEEIIEPKQSEVIEPKQSEVIVPKQSEVIESKQSEVIEENTEEKSHFINLEE